MIRLRMQRKLSRNEMSLSRQSSPENRCINPPAWTVLSTSISLSRWTAPDGKTVLIGSYDKTAKLWDMASRTTLRTFSGHTNAVVSVAFSPDGRYALTGSADQTARLWEVSSGQSVRTLSGHTRPRHKPSVAALALFSARIPAVVGR